MIKHFWDYIINHKWSKDILRANILFIILVILYDLFHFSLKSISFGFFFRTLLLMNLCLVINRALEAYEKTKKQNNHQQ